MRRLSGTAVVVWSGLLLGGCAAISGLDQIQETECAPDCDGGTADVIVDHTVDSPGMGDDSQPPQSDATQDTTGDDTGQPEASSDDSSTGNDASDGGTGVDGHADAGGVDASDSGCVLGNTQNCGACGQSCAPVGGGTKSAGCGGTSCLYACNTGYLDCNASVGYDPDGCECNVTAASSAVCCSTACPTKHSDGLTGGTYPNPNFYDCVSTGQYTSTLATDACTAYTGNAALCGTPGECTNSMDAGTGDFVVCGQQTPSGACPCWEYAYTGDAGSSVGKVTVGSGMYLTDCICPGSTGSGITTTSYQ